MPLLNVNGYKIYYEITGPDKAPVVVLSNSLGTDLSMWEPQLPAFSNKYRILRYDTLGHGKSDVPDGPYSIDQLGNDVLVLLNKLSIDGIIFCGLSMGGLIGMWLALNAGDRIDKLILANTAAKIGDDEGWDQRIEVAKTKGLEELSERIMPIWFSEEYRLKKAEIVQNTLRQMTNMTVKGYIANCIAIRDADYRSRLPEITAPTLSIAGQFDPVTPPDSTRFISDNVQNGLFIQIPAAHLSNIEASEQFNSVLMSYLN